MSHSEAMVCEPGGAANPMPVMLASEETVTIAVSELERFCEALNEAHDEILRVQGIDPKDFGNYDWPRLTPQAERIRFAERLLGRRMAKTREWTLFP